MTTNISIGLDREAGVNRFEGDVDRSGAARRDVAGDRFNLDGGRLHGRYDIESDELIIDQIALAGDRTRIGGEMRVRDVSAIMRAAPNEPAAFNISLPSMRLDVPGTFAEPIAFSNVQIVGAIVSRRALDPLHAADGAHRRRHVQRRGPASIGPKPARRRRACGLASNCKARVDGALDARDVMHVWPIGLGEGARALSGAHDSRAGASPMRRCASTFARPISPPAPCATRRSTCASMSTNARDAVHRRRCRR